MFLPFRLKKFITFYSTNLIEFLNGATDIVIIQYLWPLACYMQNLGWFDKIYSLSNAIFLPVKNNLDIATPYVGCSNISFLFLAVADLQADVVANKLLYENPYVLQDYCNNKEYESYIKNQEYLLEQLDKQFWPKIATQKSFFSPLYDLFEFQSIVPFDWNLKLDSFLFKNLTWTNIFEFNDNFGTYDIATSYYFEPFFFFWKEIQKSLDEFRMISYYRERAILFESRVYNPNIVHNDPNHIFPPLSHFSHPSEFNPGYRALQWFYGYKHTHYSPYYLDFSDFQTFTLDKNFIFLWNYWKGASNPLNIFGPRGWTGSINFLREKILSPKMQFNSIFNWEDNTYGTYASRAINFGFFPDFVMLAGQINPSFDRLTSGYNRFFHFGETYMDSSIALDSVWYQIAENYWGDFEYVVEDYSAYQFTYFPDTVATIWIPIILLATKSYHSPAEMALHLNDYNNVFMFKRFKQYKDFKAEFFFGLDLLTRLGLLRDFQQIDQRPFHLEKLIALNFGYNFSTFLSNHPRWVLDMVTPDDLYSTLIYDYDDDMKFEEWEWKLVSAMWVKNYDYSSNLSIFFKKTKFDKFFFNLPRFLNEKVFDDPGHAVTSLNRVDKIASLSSYTWVDQLSLLSCEFLPIWHFNWKITILKTTPLEWSFTLSVPPFAKLYDFFSAVRAGFSIKLIKINHTSYFYVKNQLFLNNWFFSTFYFELNFLPLFSFLIEQNKNYFNFDAKNYFTRFSSNFLQMYNWLLSNQLFFGLSNYNNLKLSSVINYFLFLWNSYSINLVVNFFNCFFFKNLYIYKFFEPISIKLAPLIKSFLCFERLEIAIQNCVVSSDDTLMLSINEFFLIYDFLPFEFFMPISKYDEDNHLKKQYLLWLPLKEHLFLPDGTELTTHNLSKIEWFLQYSMVSNLLKNNYPNKNINEMIEILNWIDYNSLKKKSLEYDRYINYVVKQSLYKIKN